MIATLFFMFFHVLCFSQNLQKSSLKIIEVFYYNPPKTENAWMLTYVIVDEQIYTGAFFDDYGDIYKFKYDMNLKQFLFNELSEKWEYSKKRNNNKSFIQMNTGIKDIDKYFFWRCFEVPAEYLIIPSELYKNDFFPFLYKQNKKVLGFFKIYFSKIKRVNTFPVEFLKKIKENSKCIENLSQYELFEDYVKCFGTP
jgi:hypothetical protein